MTVLIGHPTGNPNSHHAALAHFEAGWLEAFCVPWMPSDLELRTLGRVPGLHDAVARLRRRRFDPLSGASSVQGRIGEWGRLFRRMVGGTWADERLSYEANDWLMHVMAQECMRRPEVGVVHAYEDCALLQFEAAHKTGRRRVYDLPIGYYPAWEQVLAKLRKTYADWLPTSAAQEDRYVRPEQKAREMELAELVLAPSTFVQGTIQRFVDRNVALVPYGVDSGFWSPSEDDRRLGPLRFLFAGQCSVRKGVPLLLDAWKSAALRDCELDLVGTWKLAESRKRDVPSGVRVFEAQSSTALREIMRWTDVLVLPSYFEGFALVVLEALACGVPVLVSDATGAADVVESNCGMVVPTGDKDALVEALRQAGHNPDWVRSMRRAAREKGKSLNWQRYRERVREAVRPYLGEK